MLTDLFLQTSILSAIALGAAILVLISVLPILLPDAIRAVQDQDETLRRKLRNELAHSSEPLEKVLAKGQEQLGILREREGDIKWVFRLGAASVVAFVLSAILGLWALSLPPYISPYLVVYAPTSEVFDWLVGGSFVLGLLLAVAFAGNLSRIIAQYVKVKASTSRVQEEVRLVSGLEGK